MAHQGHNCGQLRLQLLSGHAAEHEDHGLHDQPEVDLALTQILKICALARTCAEQGCQAEGGRLPAGESLELLLCTLPCLPARLQSQVMPSWAALLVLHVS